MNNHITYRQVVDRLAENGIPYGVLALQDGISVVIAQRGGRVFGPFLSETGESIYWTHESFSDAGAFRATIASGAWNVGGERIWIAPEIQYHVRDRTDFWNSLQFPAQVDPGTYRLEAAAADRWRLSQNITLSAYNLASGVKELRLENLIRPVANPLRNVPNAAALMDGVRYAGYQQVVTLTESRSDDIESEVWNVIQLNPGGDLVIPATPRVAYSDYFESIDGEHQTVRPTHVRLKITGQRRYKVGYKAAHLFGRLGYLNRTADGQEYLLVRNFFSNPSAVYAEEPAGQPGQRGHSVHVYNDGGMFGGFGELECNGQTIGGASGRASSTDQMVLWLYAGPHAQLAEIAVQLLGVEL